jgi:hypothetical protein
MVRRISGFLQDYNCRRGGGYVKGSEFSIVLLREKPGK